MAADTNHTMAIVKNTLLLLRCLEYFMGLVTAMYLSMLMATKLKMEAVLHVT
ncbi:hypothetical protein X975_23047, partial [Stegodyphus mimosarum]